MRTLGEVADTVRGRSYRSADLADSDTALVTLKSFARGGCYRPDGLKPYTGPYKPEQVVRPGEIAIACTDLTQAAEVVGRPAVVAPTQHYETLIASLDTLIARPRQGSGISVPFLYCLCISPSFTHHTYAHVSGTTVLHLSKDAVPSFKFAMPPLELVAGFNAFAEPAFKYTVSSPLRSSLITALRDALLPRLVPGVLRVDAA